ncbi:hypothetical protein SEA_GUEY18_74 [Gordonia phage Guey18]|nr:hypothetical protein SEA_GUEY18_74 [Gordonia phage Guey18]
MSNKRIQLSDKSIQNGWRLAAETERGQLFQFTPLGGPNRVDYSLYVRYTRNNAVAEAKTRAGLDGRIIGEVRTNAKDKRGTIQLILESANA